MSITSQQKRVATFLEDHELHTTPEYRLLDLLSEVGELAKDVNSSTDYGAAPDDVSVKPDEIGDALFSLLALSDALDVDAGEALETALSKYEGRIAESGEPSSGSE